MHNNNTGKTLLVLGGSGLVGMEILRQALADPQVSRVVAPTRRPLPTAVNHSSFNCFFRQLLQISGFATHLTL